MATTPKLRIPYVSGGDWFPSYPAGDQLRADRLDDLLGGYPSRVSGMFTAAAYWRVENSYMDMVGAVAYFYAWVTYIGPSPVTVDTKGGVTLAGGTIATFDNVKYKFLGYGPIASYYGGQRLGMFYLKNNLLVLHAVAAPSQPITTNDYFELAGVAFIDPTAALNPLGR